MSCANRRREDALRRPPDSGRFGTGRGERLDRRIDITYLRGFASVHETAWSHGHSGGSEFRTPSRTRSNRTCTCAQSPHSDDVASCAAVRPEWAQMNKPATRIRG